MLSSKWPRISKNFSYLTYVSGNDILLEMDKDSAVLVAVEMNDKATTFDLS